MEKRNIKNVQMYILCKINDLCKNNDFFKKK